MKRMCMGVALLALAAAFCPAAALAAEPPARSQGGAVLVPVYSFILIGDNARPFPLAATLILRNTSLDQDITLLGVDYHDSNGKLLQQHLQAPQTMPALGSLVFTVAESEKAGGLGAKFIVKWRSARPVPPLLAETVMIGTANQQGISFTSRGQSLPAQP